MALACLACNAMENSTDSFRMDGSFRSVSSDGHGGCGGVPNCFSKKPAGPKPERTLGRPSPNAASPRVANRFGRRHGGSLDRMVHPEPRLTRCCAVRRDLFSNWTVNDIENECGPGSMRLNVSTTA